MSERTAIRRLMDYSSEYRGTVLLATLYSILNKLFDLAPPLLIGAAVDIVVRRQSSIFSDFGIIDLNQQIYTLAAITLVIWSCESIFEYMYKLKWRNLAQTIEHRLRMDTYNHIQELEMEYFEDRQTGGIMAILNDDINQLERFLDIGANTLIQIATTVIAIQAVFFVLSPEIGGIAFIPIPFVIAFSIWFQKSLEPRYAVMRDKVGVLNGRLSNNLSGMSTIKSFTNETYESDRIFESSINYKEANVSAIARSSAFSPLIRMIIVCGFLGMLIVGGFLTLAGTLEVAAYSTIIFLIQRLLWPLTGLGETLDQYQRAMASTNRVLNLLDTPVKILPGERKVNPAEVKGMIEYADVHFKYKSRDPIFNGLNITINPGETVAYVGMTGSGKTTLVKLLLRFYDPTKGMIRLDGVDIREYDFESYRSQIGMVSQDTFLIDGTVRENIAYGMPDVPLEEIIQAAEVAEIHDFVQTLPQGFETLVGERGQKLSGGQRQRISIARAVLKNPPILVFDEATSSVDNETEAAIQRSLQKLTINRTTIIIAHRLSTIRHADKILVLEHGSIIEEGTHDDLVALDGQYAALWKVQTGELLAYNYNKQ